MSGEGGGAALQVKKSGFQWVVRREALNSVRWSEVFKFGLDNGNLWRLRLERRTQDDDGTVYVRLGLHAEYRPKGHVRIKIQLGLIAKDGNEKNVKSVCKIFTDKDFYYRFDEFIALDSLLDETNGYFKDNELTIFCILEQYRTLEKPVFTLSNDFSGMLESGDFSDFTLVVGVEELKLHKCVLSSRSPVFKAMFQHDMKENQDGRLKIEDLDVVGVKALMQFIYTGEVEGLSEIADKVLPAANKYGVENLKILCEQELSNKLDAENVTELLVVADLYEAKQLKEQVLAYIRANSEEVVKQDMFWELEEDNRKLFREAVCALAVKEFSMEKLS